MPRSEKTKPQPIARHLGNLLQQIEKTYADDAHRIWEVWPSAVGPDLAARCQPLDFNRGRLVVGVNSSAWMQQIQFLQGEICSSLNKILGRPLVREIRLRAALATPSVQKAEEDPPQEPTPWLSVQLSPEAIKRIEKDLCTIEDPELRETMRRVRIRAEQFRSLKDSPTE